jgi:hypothetical protein
MQGTVVTMLLILGGLGSHSKENDDVKLPPALNDDAVMGDAKPIAMPVYPQYAPPLINAGPAPGHSCGYVLHQTLISFFLGHDDDVMTAKEIEAALHAGAYSGLNDYPPSAVLSFEGPR